MTAAAVAAGRPSWRAAAPVLLLCFLALFTSNFAFVAMGLTAPGMMTALAISKSQFGLAVSAAMFGFFLGAPGAGMSGDRYGRRWALASCIALMGLGSAATPLAAGLPQLLAARFVTGLGVGGILALGISLSAAAAGEGRSARAVAVIASGGSLGGVAAGLLVWAGRGALPWSSLFYVAAVLSFALLPVTPLALRAGTGDRGGVQGAVRGRALEALFGQGRALLTLCLWAANFFTSLALNVLLAWLPTMMVERGLGISLAGMINTVVSLGCILGSLGLSVLLDRGRRRLLFLLVYGGMAAAVCAMALVETAQASVAAAAAIGVFVLGGQVLLFSVPAIVYPDWGRGAGTGWFVGIGRWGAILGPTGAGVAYTLGMTGDLILLAIVPGLALACAALLAAITRAAKLDRTAPPSGRAADAAGAVGAAA